MDSRCGSGASMVNTRVHSTSSRCRRRFGSCEDRMPDRLLPPLKSSHFPNDRLRNADKLDRFVNLTSARIFRRFNVLFFVWIPIRVSPSFSNTNDSRFLKCSKKTAMSSSSSQHASPNFFSMSRARSFFLILRSRTHVDDRYTSAFQALQTSDARHASAFESMAPMIREINSGGRFVIVVFVLYCNSFSFYMS